MHTADQNTNFLLRDSAFMKAHLKFLLVCSLWMTLSGCSQGQTVKPSALPTSAVTEIPCPGVEPRGLATGMQAYVSIDGKVPVVDLYKEPESTKMGVSAPHHIRVTIKKGPTCAGESAWWLVDMPDGKSGWLRIGSNLDIDGEKTSVALLPFRNDAVQRDVLDERKPEAEVRYIVADIELGGADVLKYYQDQAAARPDDPGTATIKLALDILEENSGKSILANKAAFERKPLRGGTSVVDAGTEYVQPGLDILLTPCDRPQPSPACQKMLK
jgi:hypothetical protein